MKFVYDKKRREVVPKPEPKPTVLDLLVNWRNSPMTYTHLEIWEHGGQIWHALFTPGTRELSMGVLSPTSLKKTVAWARAHQLTVWDRRGCPVEEGFTSVSLVGAEAFKPNLSQ